MSHYVYPQRRASKYRYVNNLLDIRSRCHKQPSEVNEHRQRAETSLSALQLWASPLGYHHDMSHLYHKLQSAFG